MSTQLTPDLTQQPFAPFFDLTFSGQTNQSIASNPEIPMSFSFTQEVASNLNKVEAKLLDLSGMDVEPLILNSKNQNGFFEGTFKFGWLKPKVESPEWTFQLDYYVPEFEPDNAFTICLEGKTNLGMAVSQNKASGTVEQCVKKMADIHFNGKYQITQPFGTDFMLDSGYLDQDTTELREMQHTKLMTETDWNFLNRILDHARDANGLGGYSASSRMVNGTNTLIVQRPLDINQVMWTYDTSAKEKTIIKWRPVINVTEALMNGANNMHVNSTQNISGNTQKFVNDQSVTKNFIVKDGPIDPNPPTSYPKQTPADQPIYVCSETMPDNVVTNAARTVSGYGSPSPYGGYNNPLNDHLRAWQASNKASLILLGDPTLYPGVNIDMKVYYPKNYSVRSVAGKEHYTAGIWYIDRCIHTIAPGSYITVLELTKSTLNLIQ